MRLPYDYARCPGTAHVLCHNCRRLEDGHPTEQLMIYPAAEGDECINRIPASPPADEGERDAA